MCVCVFTLCVFVCVCVYAGVLCIVCVCVCVCVQVRCLRDRMQANVGLCRPSQDGPGTGSLSEKHILRCVRVYELVSGAAVLCVYVCMCMYVRVCMCVCICVCIG